MFFNARKTCCLNTAGSKEKISGSDFEIRATNLKIQGTYFSPIENRIIICSKVDG